MSKLKTILSTKTLLKIQKQLLLDANFDVSEADFIETKFIDFDLKNINNTLIFTSQNSVNSVLNHPKIEELKSKTAFCVGLKTRALLEENEFKVEAYTSYAEDLAEIITLIYADESFTFFCGNLRRDTLPNTLKENGIKFNEIQVYQTNLKNQKASPNPSKGGESKFDGILFFSPSAVDSYLKWNKITSEICFAIGNTTSEALEKNNIKNIEIADYPSTESVIEKVINY